MNYLDKYKGQEGRRSVLDIMRLDPNAPADWEIIKTDYTAVDIEKVIIDGDTFTNYGDFQFVWEKSYVKSPARSNSGAIDNLDSYATFVTPHLIINFSIMSIDDYRAIMRKDLERNEFTVECYDPIYNQKTINKMYFATPSVAKLRTIARKRFNSEDWEEFVEIVGVDSYTVELIGTNNDLDFVSVVYHLNPPADTGVADQTIGEKDVYIGEEVIIGASASEFVNETFNGKYKFKRWGLNPQGEGNTYTQNYAYTINAPMILYALWDNTTDYILSFNYGLADPAIDEETYTYETSRKVVKGQGIGALPAVPSPKVAYKGKEYYPYYDGHWYKTPIRVFESNPISNDAPYWLNRDSTIYLLYLTSHYTLKLYIEENGKQELYQVNLVKYGDNLNLPLLVKNNLIFDAWYETSDYQQGSKFNETMPPYDLTLYARWVKK